MMDKLKEKHILGPHSSSTKAILARDNRKASSADKFFLEGFIEN